ncbi:hypothetical protein GCM10009682_45170 [Luedemannella flava]|uniref:Sulfatase-modifying factor enzyme-like domain-containing protein n=1 Tax=Luedemannella flava TaxID=349316 RepID=A0ABN2MBZ9_9ACTN
MAVFYIDVHPVTVDDYARFVEQTGHRPPGKAPQPYLEPLTGDHPVVRVTWQDAVDYATWAGKRLPSAREREKAARGPAGNLYPWGSDETLSRFTIAENYLPGTTAIGEHPDGAGPYGARDMCGNVWEWTGTAAAGATCAGVGPSGPRHSMRQPPPRA